MKKLITTSVICFLLGLTIQAQILPDGYCASNRKLQELFKNNPELEEHYYANQLLMNSKNIYHLFHLCGSGN